jgi:hypothetical protein
MESVSDSFEWFADWADGVSPLYERLARASATDEELLDIAGEASDGQPPPNLLFGAVHALLLEGRAHRLAAFYPTCTERPVQPDEDDPFEPFREFCLDNEDDIREMVASRRVQTNEVGRSAVLFPSFKYVAEQTDDTSLAVIEIGASAGLNLLWDQFRYEYDGMGTFGEMESPVTIQSGVRGNTNPPVWATTPPVENRVGIDINPLDVTDDSDARWLRALVIPDQYERFERLDDAIELANTAPPRLVAGDALDVLPDVLSQIPPDRTVVVFSTLVLYQLDESDIEALETLLEEQSEKRPIHWLSNDPITDQTPPTYRHVSFENGTESRQLAEFKAHGEWIRWNG